MVPKIRPHMTAVLSQFAEGEMVLMRLRSCANGKMDVYQVGPTSASTGPMGYLKGNTRVYHKATGTEVVVGAHAPAMDLSQYAAEKLKGGLSFYDNESQPR